LIGVVVFVVVVVVVIGDPVVSAAAIGIGQAAVLMVPCGSRRGSAGVAAGETSGEIFVVVVVVVVVVAVGRCRASASYYVLFISPPYSAATDLASLRSESSALSLLLQSLRSGLKTEIDNLAIAMFA
jgi:hypothetical protein